MTRDEDVVENDVSTEDLTEQQMQQLHGVCSGVDFDLVLDLERATAQASRARLSAGRGERRTLEPHPFATLCNTVSARIGMANERSALGGENVLAIFHADEFHASSIHLMHFRGRQDMHSHPGPRLLTIISNDPWYLYVGGDGPTVVDQEVIPVAKIAFPGSSLTLVRFRSNFLHGFEGRNFAAISSHYTDLEELAGKGVGGDRLVDSAHSEHIMKNLTSHVDQDRLRPIFRGAISAYGLADVFSGTEHTATGAGTDVPKGPRREDF